MQPDKNLLIEYNVCKARGQLVTYTKSEMCSSFRPSRMQKRQRHHRFVYFVWVARTYAWIGFIIHG